MFKRLTLRNKIFLISTGLILLALILIWIFVKPIYQQTIVNERTTIVSQLQEYALKRADVSIRNWQQATTYLSNQVIETPESAQDLITKTINLTPGLLRVYIGPDNDEDPLAVTRGDVSGFDFEKIEYDWVPSSMDSQILVSWYEMKDIEVVFFTTQRYIQIGETVFRIRLLFDATRISDELLNIPLGGNYQVSVLQNNSQVILGSDSLNYPADLLSSEGYSQFRELELSGNEWYVLTSGFQTIPIWHVISVDDAFILQPVNSMIRYTLVAAGSIFLLMIFFSWYVSKRINSPVNAIISDVENMQDLDFEKEIRPVELPEFRTMRETLESIRVKLQRYKEMNVERIILEEWKNKYLMTYTEDMLGFLDESHQFSFTNRSLTDFLDDLRIGLDNGKPELILEHPDIESGEPARSEFNNDPYKIHITNHEIRHLKNDHPEFYDYQQVSISDHSGKEHAAMILIHDKTEERLLDIKRNDMINIIVHELKNPVAGIKGLSGLILDDENPDPVQYRNLVQEISNAGERMNALVNRFLDVQKLELGRKELVYTSFDIIELYEDVISILKPQLMDKNIKIDMLKTGHGFTLNAERDLIFDAVQNLISNAIKYGDDNRTMEVDIKNTGDVMQFSITDYGFGISLEDQKKVFEKFFRVKSNAKSARVAGTGLGLAYVKEIVNQHKGEIKLESNEEIGSRFTIDIPLNAGPQS